MAMILLFKKRLGTAALEHRSLTFFWFQELLSRYWPEPQILVLLCRSLKDHYKIVKDWIYIFKRKHTLSERRFILKN